jgi:ribokinase
MKHIVVLGSSNTDMVITGNKIPVPGETVSGGKFFMNPGGKGANQAVAVARLAKDVKCVFISKVGNDLFGRDTKARLEKDGIDVKLSIDSTEPSGTALILIDKDGMNSISVAPGANRTLCKEEILPHKKTIETAAALLMQLETPVETVLTAAKWANEAGVPVILNPAPACKLPDELFSLIDWITPNETEAEILSGVPVKGPEGAAQAAERLKALGVKNVIVTMGSQGCWCGKMYPPKPTKVVDTVAAGDTFNGGFVVGISESMGYAEAIDFAQTASAIAVSRPGVQSSIPKRSEIKQG